MLSAFRTLSWKHHRNGSLGENIREIGQQLLLRSKAPPFQKSEKTKYFPPKILLCALTLQLIFFFFGPPTTQTKKSQELKLS